MSSAAWRRFSQIWKGRKHLGVHDPSPGREPLNVPVAVTRGGAERVGMIHETATDDGDGLEAAVRMLRKPRHDVAVVHPPSVGRGEVAAHRVSGERRRGTELVVAGRVCVVVMDAEEERIGRPPLKSQRERTANELDGARALGRALEAPHARFAEEHTRPTLRGSPTAATVQPRTGSM
jgi:hypothetical protein